MGASRVQLQSFIPMELRSGSDGSIRISRECPNGRRDRLPRRRPPRSAGATGVRARRLLLHVPEDRIDLPAVPIGVRQPELLLERVAALPALLLFADEASRLEISSPAANLFRRFDADAEVRERSLPAGPRPARLERQMDL